MKAELRALKDQNRIAAEQMKGLQDQIRRSASVCADHFVDANKMLTP